MDSLGPERRLPSAYPAQAYPIGGAPNDAGALGVWQVLAVLRRRWWLVLLAGAAMFTVAWIFVPANEVRFQATAVVRLADTRRALTGNLDGTAADNVQAMDFVSSQLHVIRSRGVAGEVVDRTGLRVVVPAGLADGVMTAVSVDPAAAPDSLRFRFSRDGFTVLARGEELAGAYGVPAAIGGIRFTIAGMPLEGSAKVAVVSREAAIDRLLRTLRPVIRDRSSIIDIGYSDVDPERAQLVVNTVAEVFREHNIGRVREQSHTRRQFVEEQLGHAEGRLVQAQAALSTFRARGRAISSRDQLTSEQNSLMSLDVRREELDADRRMARSLLARVDQSQGDAMVPDLRALMSAPGVSGNPVVAQLFAQLVQHESERQRLLADGRSETHPDVERTTRLVGSTRADLVSSVRSHIATLDTRIASLDDLRGRSAASMRELPAVENEESRLVHEVETVRRITDLLRDEFQRAQIAEAVEIGQVEVLDVATFATAEVSGRRMHKLGIALGFGLLLGGGGALLVELSNSSVRRREDLDELVRIPELGVIPPLSKGVDPGAMGRFLPQRLRGISARSGPSPRPLVDATDPHSAGAEAYRIVRTNLFFSSEAERVKTLVVTSALSGEGKTTTAANLAVTLTRQGKRVLLIDCDLRRPQLHRLFGVARDPGFSDVLGGRCEPSDAIRASALPGLFVMPRGSFDVDAVEMLGAQRTRSLLDSMAERFDIVLLDTAPVLVAADAPALAALSHGVILVVRAGRTDRNALRFAFEQLAAVGANVVGSVLNDPDATAASAREQYYRHYYAIAG